jgi:hypothetical protein
VVEYLEQHAQQHDHGRLSTWCFPLLFRQINKPIF